jgi:GNAT superfamily N-acetyltransferase
MVTHKVSRWYQYIGRLSPHFVLHFLALSRALSPRSTPNMPLTLSPITTQDTLSWTRIRALAYYGPTHDVLHSGPIRETSILATAEARKRDLLKSHTWFWKIVDTELEPSADDPPDNGGRTIAIAAWSMHNVPKEEPGELATTVAAVSDSQPAYFPPELRMDALASLFGPLRAMQQKIMGTAEQYFMLDSLATHPEQQGRGAASMLINWGVSKADAEGLFTYLDATGVGKPVYENRGFEIRKALEWDRLPWGGEGKDCHFGMVRAPRKRDM